MTIVITFGEKKKNVQKVSYEEDQREQEDQNIIKWSLCP
jgi:hypothetical protein